ncbi:Dabb [Geosmithia morbida]|uniref:Dabb n=1 Tax=Geosmithia morbida TaxID=1094350 RepID=A0A9P4YRP1_9HYPO|nr:Dabb [Geosmithia morbida]KAF4120592.1 Dabb [Geosmithia morbida]
MTLFHTVFLQFKADTDADKIKDACARFVELRNQCIHPTSNSPYLLSLKAGKDHSEAGLQDGITHGFVLEFSSTEDRDYYMSRDPAHSAFEKVIGELISKVIVVDFTDGVF